MAFGDEDDQRQLLEAHSFFQSTLQIAQEENLRAVRAAPASERLEAAQELKNEGNDAYKAGDLEEAVKLYARALSVFRYFRKSTNKEGVEFVLDERRLDEDGRRQAEEVIVTILLNTATALLRLRDPQGSASVCNEALKIDDRNVKALYKRAVANVELGSSSNLDLAVKDLTRAATIDPSKEDVKAALKKARQLSLEQDKKDKEAFAGLFDRGELYNRDEVGIKAESREPEGREEMTAAKFKHEARQFGLNLEEPWAKKRLQELLRKEEMQLRKRNLKKPEAMSSQGIVPNEEFQKDDTIEHSLRRRLWQFLSRAFDKRYWVSVPTLMYAIIVTNIVYRIYLVVHYVIMQ